MKFNKTTIAALKLPQGKTESIVFDDDLPGFGVRIRAGGKRTWIAQYRLGSKQRRMTLGTLEALNETEARKRARTALSKVHLGHDPQMEKVEVRAQAAVTLANAVENYLARAERKLKPRSFVEVKRHLRQHWGSLAQFAMAKIHRPDVAGRLATIARENGPVAANRARAALSALFSWAIGEGLTDVNPVIGTNKPVDEISRDRVLSDEELSLIWKHAGEGEYGSIIRVLVLTGQRREEVGGMLWRELHLDTKTWSIEAGRTKNGLPHDVPLSPLAVSVLEGINRREKRDLVFGAGEGAFQGWSNAKAALDLRIAGAIAQLHGDEQKFNAWRLHDIRRTVATRMGDIGVQPHVVEAVLNHVSGNKAGVAGIYNRASYATEKRQALDLWAGYVTGLSTGH